MKQKKVKLGDTFDIKVVAEVVAILTDTKKNKVGEIELKIRDISIKDIPCKVKIV